VCDVENAVLQCLGSGGGLPREDRGKAVSHIRRKIALAILLNQQGAFMSLLHVKRNLFCAFLGRRRNPGALTSEAVDIKLSDDCTGSRTHSITPSPSRI